uniref:Uncharacterized protein n=3 Tax=Chrysotila carterae TaxID=13221 RepID=A0A6S9TUF3_CHRCT|mmetsp:Transcript_41166/g.90370  ORF Transcript_41166/g.90370 Transcript_41166/m.90370 type:complete len:421 (+) Transcript_41166:152-1414(+)
MADEAQTARDAPLLRAHALAVEAEDLFEEGRWKQAAQSFELAAEHYVKATLSTSDVGSLQSLRELALAHLQRAHELKCRYCLHATYAKREEGNNGGTTTTKGDSPAPAASAALTRLGSQLITTLEALQFGAEELACTELLLPSANPSTGMRTSTMLSDSYCVVPGMPPPGAARDAAACCHPCGATSEVHGSEMLLGSRSAHEVFQAQRQQVSHLAAENATLKQRVTELQAALVKVQRRAKEQLRLSKKALAALRDVQAVPRPELLPTAAAEIKALRQQLDELHATRRQQAEQVRKYEQRWAQLKASARRRQQLKEQQQQQHTPAQGQQHAAQHGAQPQLMQQRQLAPGMTAQLQESLSLQQGGGRHERAVERMVRGGAVHKEAQTLQQQMFQSQHLHPPRPLQHPKILPSHAPGQNSSFM